MGRRKTKRRSGLFVIAAAVLLLCGLIVYSERDLLREKRELEKQVTELNEAIENENKETAELQSKQAYMQTVRYVEDVAREKLGLVYEDEIIYRAEDDED